MNFEAIARKLHNDGIGAIGISIFIGHMPQSAERGILLRESYIGTSINYELPNYRNTRFHVIVRSKRFEDGRNLMNDVMNSLTLSETTLPGMDIRYIRPKTEPLPYPLNEAALFEFLVIFEAVYVIV